MKITRLTEVRNERKRADAKELRKDLYAAMRSAITEDTVGYAIVTWDKDGSNYSTLKPGGPIATRMVPTFAGDALTQHVTIDLVTGRR